MTETTANDKQQTTTLYGITYKRTQRQKNETQHTNNRKLRASRCAKWKFKQYYRKEHIRTAWLLSAK